MMIKRDQGGIYLPKNSLVVLMLRILRLVLDFFLRNEKNWMQFLLHKADFAAFHL